MLHGSPCAGKRCLKRASFETCRLLATMFCSGWGAPMSSIPPRHAPPIAILPYLAPVCPVASRFNTFPMSLSIIVTTLDDCGNDSNLAIAALRFLRVSKFKSFHETIELSFVKVGLFFMLVMFPSIAIICHVLFDCL